MMAENPNAQEEIMRRLPEEEILKMMTFLEDPDSSNICFLGPDFSALVF